MSHVAPSQYQAEQLKQDGNLCFKKARLGTAIDAYTEAIVLCPNVVVYWTNRALCHRRRNDWSNVENDCRKALPLDQNSVKAHYMLGLALLEKKEYTEGIKELEKALDLGRGADPNGYMVEEIWRDIANAKYSEWEHKSSKRLWELQTVKDNCKMALKEQQVIDPFQKEGFMDRISISDARELEVLEQVFRKAAEEDIPTEVGKFDPVTREQLSPSQLVPNLAIKEAVKAYLEKHGWAYRMD